MKTVLVLFVATLFTTNIVAQAAQSRMSPEQSTGGKAAPSPAIAATAGDLPSVDGLHSQLASLSPAAGEAENAPDPVPSPQGNQAPNRRHGHELRNILIIFALGAVMAIALAAADR